MHQVFISYADRDQEAASRVCEMLEADGAGCWFKARDAAAGEDGTRATLDAIRTSDLVLLVFSASANASADVLREIEKAVAYERPLLPVRIDDAVPSFTLQQYLDVAGATSASAPPETATQPAPPPLAGAGRRLLSRRTWGIVAGGVAVALALALGLGLGLTGQRSTWTALSPSGPEPSPRAAAAMAYDAVTQRLIMFSGGDATNNFNDTWAYDPGTGTWTELKPSGELPVPRMYASMAYDPITRRLIMFGGLHGATNLCLSDTWAYDAAANTWTNLKPDFPTPPVRAWHVMVSDPETGKLVIFGGMTRGLEADLVAVDQLNDTWEYDPSANTWTILRPAGSVPAARYAYAMVHDPSSKQIILFGGITGTTRFGDTWTYDPAANVWKELKPVGAIPRPRGGQSMAYDPSTGRVIMFGGAVSLTTLFNDTWAYDSGGNTWRELEPGGTPPSPRGGHAMVVDPTSRRLIAFGGLDDTGSFRSDVWALSP